MMFFWSEIPRWIYAVALLAVLAIAAIIYSMVRGQVSVSAGAVQYMDEYNQKGSNPREVRTAAPPGGFKKREGEPEHNTVIDRNKPGNPPANPAPVNPRGGGRGERN